jgi:hypothetical protein
MSDDVQCERCGVSGPSILIKVDDTIPLVIVKRNIPSEPDAIFSVLNPARDVASPPFCLRCLDKVLEQALNMGDKTFGQVFERLRRAELQ